MSTAVAEEPAVPPPPTIQGEVTWVTFALLDSKLVIVALTVFGDNEIALVIVALTVFGDRETVGELVMVALTVLGDREIEFVIVALTVFGDKETVGEFVMVALTVFGLIATVPDTGCVACQKVPDTGTAVPLPIP